MYPVLLTLDPTHRLTAALTVQPGRHIALSSIWISVASILACYDIRKEVDAAGREVAPDGQWYGGPTLFNRPLPFKCRFVPRSRAAEATIVSLENTL